MRPLCGRIHAHFTVAFTVCLRSFRRMSVSPRALDTAGGAWMSSSGTAVEAPSRPTKRILEIETTNAARGERGTRGDNRKQQAEGHRRTALHRLAPTERDPPYPCAARDVR